MKSKLFLTVLVLVSIAATAQKTKFGAKAGLNVSVLSLSGNIPSGGQTSAKTGFVVGATAEFEISKKFGVQPELLFSTDGGTYNYTNSFAGSGSVYSYSQSISTNSLSLPVIAKYYVTNDLSIDAGFQLSYLLSAKSELNFNSNGFTVTGNNDMNNNQSNLISNGSSAQNLIINHDYELNKLNFGLVLGTTYNLKNGLFLQARYNLGLTNFTKNANVLAGKEIVSGGSGDDRYKGANLKNAAFQLTVGYKFK